MCFLSVVDAEAIEDIQIQEELEDIQKPLKKPKIRKQSQLQ